MSTDRLPPGRHGLSRDEVTGSQRNRMLRGMTEAAAELGYAKVSVADVLKRAGVSRETFYEQFANKEDCFLAAYGATVVTLMEALRAAIPSPPEARADGPLERSDRFIDCYLDTLIPEPTLAWNFLIEINAVGPKAVKQRTEAQAFAVGELAAAVGADDDRRRVACEALFATMVGLVTQRVGAGRIGELGDLRGPLKEFARASLTAVGIGEPRSAAADTGHA